MSLLKKITALSMIALSLPTFADKLKIESPAPLFKIKTHEGKIFDLAERKDKWTVLYFYPKADTPGCTTQACAFRDSINVIREQGADVFGVSVDTIDDQAKFHKKHHLNFVLLADADGAVTELYGSKMMAIKISKRWTYIIDPDLKIRAIEKDVDPAKDAENVAAQIKQLKLATDKT